MIVLKYWNAKLKIGFADWKRVYQFPEQQLLYKEIHQGGLYYRRPGSSKRISYKQLKKGLEKRQMIIYEEISILPF